MKREVSRRRVLPAFRLDMAELELLQRNLLALFDDPTNAYARLTIEQSGEKLEFDNLDELKDYTALPATLKNFSLWFSQGGRSISIGTSGLFDSRLEVRTSGHSEAWCAGAVETVATFVSRHRVWYYWFLVVPVGWLLAVLTYGAFLSMAIVPREVRISPIALVAWIAVTISLLVLYFVRVNLLPLSTLELRQKDGFLREHMAELSLPVGVVSLVLTVVGWFLIK